MHVVFYKVLSHPLSLKIYANSPVSHVLSVCLK